MRGFAATTVKDLCESIFCHAARIEPDIRAAMTARGIEAEWTPASLAVHTRAVLQGASIHAKATGDGQVARDSVDHLAGYLELLFQPEGPRPEPMMT